MLDLDQIDELASLVATMDRVALTEQFASYQAGFPVDFTPEFLASEPLERLRHIFLAMCLATRRTHSTAGVVAA